MELDNIIGVKQLAVDAMTGHVPCTPKVGEVMNCPTCSHSNKLNPDEVHRTGQCTQCNCGQSEIVHRTSMAGYYISKIDSFGRGDSGDGRYRVFEAPTLR